MILTELNRTEWNNSNLKTNILSFYGNKYEENETVTQATNSGTRKCWVIKRGHTE
jgi:hypothetical protein